jgi:hypothetical protein
MADAAEARSKMFRQGGSEAMMAKNVRLEAYEKELKAKSKKLEAYEKKNREAGGIGGIRGASLSSPSAWD